VLLVHERQFNDRDRSLVLAITAETGQLVCSAEVSPKSTAARRRCSERRHSRRAGYPALVNTFMQSCIEFFHICVVAAPDALLFAELARH
jgi:hypothetical protein